MCTGGKNKAAKTKKHSGVLGIDYEKVSYFSSQFRETRERTKHASRKETLQGNEERATFVRACVVHSLYCPPAPQKRRLIGNVFCRKIFQATPPPVQLPITVEEALAYGRWRFLRLSLLDSLKTSAFRGYRGFWTSASGDAGVTSHFVWRAIRISLDKLVIGNFRVAVNLSMKARLSAKK